VQEREGSEDSHGRALWGLGTVLGDPRMRGCVELRVVSSSLRFPLPLSLESARVRFRLAGPSRISRFLPGDRAALGAADELANRLLSSYLAVHSTSWNWFEYGLAYSNARLPQALIRAGMRGGNDEMISAGLAALDGWGRFSAAK